MQRLLPPHLYGHIGRMIFQAVDPEAEAVEAALRGGEAQCVRCKAWAADREMVHISIHGRYSRCGWEGNLARRCWSWASMTTRAKECSLRRAQHRAIRKMVREMLSGLIGRMPKRNRRWRNVLDG